MAPVTDAAGSGTASGFAGRLDAAASRRAALAFAVRLAALAALPLPALATGQSLAQYLAMAFILFLAGAWLALASAVIRGERPGGPSLNFWDESGAFCLAAALAAAGAALAG